MQRLIRSFGATSYGQLVNLALQIATVPVFLHFLSLRDFGIWLTIAAIPAYLSLADLGVATAAANRMTSLVAVGRQQEAKRVFDAAKLAVVTTVLVIGSLAVASILLVSGAPTEQTLALLYLVGGVLVAQVGGLGESVYRAVGDYARGTTIATSIRVVEWLGYLCGLVVDPRLSIIALGGLLGRLLGTFWVLFSARRHQQIFNYKISVVPVREVGRLLRAGLGIVGLTTSSLISVQGATLIVAALFSPATVAIFNVYRTIARVAVQGTSILSHALEPELAARRFSHSSNEQYSFFKLASRANFVLSFVITCALVLSWAPALAWWTSGKVPFDPHLMWPFAVWALVASTWHVARSTLIALGQHELFALFALLVASIGVALSYILAGVFASPGIVYGLIPAELTVCLVAVLQVRRSLRRLGQE